MSYSSSHKSRTSWTKLNTPGNGALPRDDRHTFWSTLRRKRAPCATRQALTGVDVSEKCYKNAHLGCLSNALMPPSRHAQKQTDDPYRGKHLVTGGSIWRPLQGAGRDNRSMAPRERAGPVAGLWVDPGNTNRTDNLLNHMHAGCVDVAPGCSGVTHYRSEGILPSGASRDRPACAPWQTVQIGYEYKCTDGVFYKI
jgi:hypothetical protein